MERQPTGITVIRKESLAAYRVVFIKSCQERFGRKIGKLIDERSHDQICRVIRRCVDLTFRWQSAT